MTTFRQKLQEAGGLATITDFFREKRDSYALKKTTTKKANAVWQPIRFPWQKSARAELIEKKAFIERHGVKKGHLMRVKYPEKHRPTKVGPGFPSRGLIYANLRVARGTQVRNILKKAPSGLPLMYEPLKTKIPQPISNNVFKDYCSKLGIGVFTDEPPKEDPNVGLDLTTFDLYWEDIKIERDVLIRELRHMPLKEKVDLVYLALFEKSMFHLARSCYYSPTYTHQRCKDIIHIFLWLLNRRNLPLVFHVKVMQCLSLILYSSPVFKKELVKCGGIRVLAKIMQLGMVFSGLQASWAAYCLTVAAIGCSEVIKEIKGLSEIDERIGEMSFHMFWYHWPTNFGMVLQSILYGPGGVANSMDYFEFL